MRSLTITTSDGYFRSSMTRFQGLPSLLSLTGLECIEDIKKPKKRKKKCCRSRSYWLKVLLTSPEVEHIILPRWLLQDPLQRLLIKNNNNKNIDEDNDTIWAEYERFIIIIYHWVIHSKMFYKKRVYNIKLTKRYYRS